MRIISTIAVAAVIATTLSGCVSYSKHEREERVVAHRSGGYRAEGYDRHGGYYRHRDHHDRYDHGGHDRHHRGGGDRYYRHRPRGH